MNGDLHDLSDPVDPEDDDRKLWELLAQAKRPEVSPYFARRVLREAALLPKGRQSPAWLRGLKAWWQAGLPLLRPPRAAAWPGALVATFICVVSVMMNFSNDASTIRVGPPAETEDWQSQRVETVAPKATATPDAAKVETSAAVSGDSSTGALTAVVAGDSLTQQDAEVIADLDNLMAREETHLWTDDNAGF